MSDPSLATEIPQSTTDRAVDMLSQMESAAASPEILKVTDTPLIRADAPATPTEQVAAVPASAEPEVLDLAPDTKVRFKVNGEEKIASLAEYKEILSRTDVFTQRQQALSQQRQELENATAQRLAQLEHYQQQLDMRAQQLAQQQDPVQQLVQRLAQQQQSGKKQNPNEIATIGELQQALAAMGQQFNQRLEAERQGQQTLLEQKEATWREQAEIEQGRAQFSDAVSKLMDTPDGKLLAKVNPKAEALIRFNTGQMEPHDVPQAIEYAQQVARDMAAQVRSVITQESTVAAVAKAKTVLEPNSGSPAPIKTTPKPIALGKDGSIDWVAMRAKAMTYLED